MKNGAIFFILLLFSAGCTVSRNFNPAQKYAPEVLQKDYGVFKKMLEEEHPGLYWYTPKDSMDAAFEQGQIFLKDSLTESGFRKVLSRVVAQIRCGHTSVYPSKQWNRAADSLRVRPFPLSIKLWPDTAVVTGNLARRDSIVTRGAVLHAIEGRPMQQIIDSLFGYLSADGYNLTHKYQTLSNRGAFGAAYTAVFGRKPRYNVTIADSTGKPVSATVRLFQPRDTTLRSQALPMPAPLSRRERKKMELDIARSLRFDTALSLATMDLNTFTKDARLPRFFKRAFKKLKKKQTQNLIIDLRANGGGSVTNSNLLTKYISCGPFKIADSLYAVARRSRYGRYQEGRLWNRLFLLMLTRRRSDGNYHFRYYENRHFKPRRRHHFNGDVYILTGGNTFSASTLFIQAIVKQENVTVVGEETGGGAYGNNAWLIPEVTLPRTKVRFRLPLFRLVIDKTAEKGAGVRPEVEVLPTVGAIRRGADYKTEKAMELIKAKQQPAVSKGNRNE